MYDQLNNDNYIFNSTEIQWMWIIMRADSLTKHSQVGESAERKESISVDELDLVSAQVSVER